MAIWAILPLLLGCATSQPQNRGGGRADFERALQQKIDSGQLHATSLTVSYPDGTRRSFAANRTPRTEVIKADEPPVNAIPNKTNAATYAYSFTVRDATGNSVPVPASERRTRLEVPPDEGAAFLDLLPDSRSLAPVPTDKTKSATEQMLAFKAAHVLRVRLKNDRLAILSFTRDADVIQYSFGKRGVVPANIRGDVLGALERWHARWSDATNHSTSVTGKDGGKPVSKSNSQGTESAPPRSGQASAGGGASSSPPASPASPTVAAQPVSLGVRYSMDVKGDTVTFTDGAGSAAGIFKGVGLTNGCYQGAKISVSTAVDDAQRGRFFSEFARLSNIPLADITNAWNACEARSSSQPSSGTMTGLRSLSLARQKDGLFAPEGDPQVLKHAQDAYAREPWRKDFKVFLQEVANIGAAAKRPDDFQLLKSIRNRTVLNNNNGPAIVILPDGFENELHGVIEQRFVGKVMWSGPVLGATNDAQKGITTITLAWPEVNGLRTTFDISDTGFNIKLPSGSLPSGLPRVGTPFSFTGLLKRRAEKKALDKNELCGDVSVWYGVGSNAGKCFFILTVSDVEPAAPSEINPDGKKGG